MGFRDEADVRKYLGGIFEAAFADPELGPKLKATGIVLKTNYTDPEAVIIVDATTGSVYAGDTSTESTAEMTMAADLGNAYWQGKVNLPIAMAKRQVKVGGNIASFLKLAPLGKQLFPKYTAMLQADGRDDLLV